MHKRKKVIINTGPLIALSAATGNLEFLRNLYSEIIVPYEVCQEITFNKSYFCADLFINTSWLCKYKKPAAISPLLRNLLDPGEAAVIQTALDTKIKTVAIDESAGRRIARLHGLTLTGSLGILLRAKREKQILSLSRAIENMEKKGVWLSPDLKKYVLSCAGEH